MKFNFKQKSTTTSFPRDNELLKKNTFFFLEKQEKIKRDKKRRQHAGTARAPLFILMCAKLKIT